MIYIDYRKLFDIEAIWENLVARSLSGINIKLYIQTAKRKFSEKKFEVNRHVRQTQKISRKLDWFGLNIEGKKLKSLDSQTTKFFLKNNDVSYDKLGLSISKK